MTKKNIFTWLSLIVLTVLAGLVSKVEVSFLIPIILLFAALKFIGVAFSFMEMSKANLVWKVLILGYLFIFCGVIIVLI